jgi:hypothetical protein
MHTSCTTKQFLAQWNVPVFGVQLDVVTHAVGLRGNIIPEIDPLVGHSSTRVALVCFND